MTNDKKTKEVSVPNYSKRRTLKTYIIVIVVVILLYNMTKLAIGRYAYLKGYRDTWEQLESADKLK